MALLINLAIFVGLLVLGFAVGGYRERAHLASLDRREAEMADIVVVNLASVPAGFYATAGTMVAGNVVVGSDYFKGFLAKFRAFFGGEVRSYAILVERARREARLRMLSEARSHGHNLVINVRFEWSDVTPGFASAEVLCLATSLRAQPIDAITRP